jgi:Pvc16 N-terminal domain
MIYHAIHCIETQLKANPPDINAAAGSISEISSGNNTDNDIIISLINVEENRISRDPVNYTRVGTSLLLKNPAVHLNLTLMFTALRSETAYGTALQNLQRVIQFFQSKYLFDHANTAELDPGIEKLILEMVTISFEQLNQLWAVLGGKYLPSVIYRMRMVTIDSITDQPADLITEIEANYHLK